MRLLRNTATDPPSEGIYHCVVEDDTMTEHTLYVGLYNSGSGKLIIICMYVRMYVKHFYMLPFSGAIAIPTKLSFILHSDLNDETPWFTLTCISTGGPATTVIWSNPESDIVTSENITVLNNAQSAEYIHTLNVTGRPGGLYTCTVENSKPSSDSSQLSIKGTE